MGHLFAVNANAWPFPWGYVYRNLLGNILASVVWAGPPFALGIIVGRRRLRRVDAHNCWMAEHLARVHLALTGEHADPHPDRGELTQ